MMIGRARGPKGDSGRTALASAGPKAHGTQALSDGAAGTSTDPLRGIPPHFKSPPNAAGPSVTSRLGRAFENC